MSEPITQLQSSDRLIPIEYVNDDKDNNEKQNLSIHEALNGVAESESNKLVKTKQLTSINPDDEWVTETRGDLNSELDAAQSFLEALPLSCTTCAKNFDTP